jgi:hypothetical protein
MERTITIRSFSVAVYLIALGFEPVGVELLGDRVLYRFPVAALEGQKRYMNDRQRLDALEAAVRAGGPRSERQGQS